MNNIPTKQFTKNEIVALMHRNTAVCLNRISDHLKKHSYPAEKIPDILIEIADELTAQAMVVELRDNI